MSQWRGETDRLFSDFFGSRNSGGISRGFPPVNISESNDSLDISVVGDELTIKGRRSGASEDGQTYHRRERTTGEIARVLRLRVEVDADHVSAALNDGVLLITLPKSEAAKPRRVQVKAAK